MKILFITNKIPLYRVPLYNMLGKEYDMTIAHIGNRVDSMYFKEVILKENKIGLFFHFKGIKELNSFNIILVYLNVRLINLYSIVFSMKKRFKVIVYGIGVSASYDKRYDRDKKVGYLIKHIVNHADAAIFYDDYPVIKYCSLGVTPEKMFVAYNTVASSVENISPLSKRNSIIFIGTLYEQKKIFQLLLAYKIAMEEKVDFPVLYIIGDGSDKQLVATWIKENKSEKQIRLLGEITDEDSLKQYFDRALICISPGQAGLTVLKSFSYGVPVITSFYPISGGEFTAIIDGVTGFFYDGTARGLYRSIKEVLARPDLESINENCKVFYDKFRSPKVWAEGVHKAIKYVMRNNS